jgi:HlyD family secretion protein
MAQQETGNSRSWIYILVALAACAAIFSYYKLNHTEVMVRSALVERQDIVSTVSTNGKVEPSDLFQAHAPMPGDVAQIFVNLNDKVKPGQELVKMDDSDASKAVAAARANLQSSIASQNAIKQGGTQDERLTANADLASAKLQQQQAAASVASLKKLQAQGAASANEVAAAEQKLTDAQARVSQLQVRRSGRYGSEDIATQQSMVNQAKASLFAAQSDYAAVDIRAPFAGTVYAIPVSQYDFVNAGEMLLEVADLTKLQVRAYFDEPEVGKLAVGQPVTIVWDAKPNLVWHGHVLEAPTTIINYNTTRNVGECLISVDDAHGDLLPNTNVTVTVTTQRHPNVLSLPREALHTDGGKNFVYKIVDGKLVRTDIQVGTGINLTRFEITAGLGQGDVVALGATTEADLTDGLRVKVTR